MRSVPSPLSLLLPVVLLASCTDSGDVTAPSDKAGAPQFAVAGNSGCYTVKFTTLFTQSDQLHVSGVVSGDLEGTAFVEATDIGRFTGVTLTVGGTIDWSITGGIIPELIGETFLTRLENRNIFLPGTSLVQNVGSLRSISGVEKANLTYIGETSLETNEARFEFNGVICP